MTTAIITETEIPVLSKEVKFFCASHIKLMDENDRASIDGLKDKSVEEPFFYVKEDDRTYIYSMKKLIQGVNQEISKCSDNRLINWSLFLGSPLAFALIMFVFNSSGRPNELMVGLSITMFCYGAVGIAFNKNSSRIKNLKNKKEYILAASQHYLKHLKEEVKKPVIVE